MKHLGLFILQYKTYTFLSGFCKSLGELVHGVLVMLDLLLAFKILMCPIIYLKVYIHENLSCNTCKELNHDEHARESIDARLGRPTG
jgi:hypothetical protein